MQYSILITTKNRLSQLQLTLKKIENFINRDDVECLIYDDGSNDNTFKTIKASYPEIKLLKNLKSKGLIKMKNFENNPHKINYIYILTPRGLAEKAKLTMNFMKRKMREYDELKKEME